MRDVQRKSPEAAQELAVPDADAPASRFNWLKSRGYFHTGFEWNQHQFDSLAGNIRLRYRNGNVDTLAIGELAGLDIQNQNNINRFLLITCGVDEGMIPEPEKPGEDVEDEIAQRVYQRLLNERNEMLELSRTRAHALNQVHADWLYVISQDDVTALFPPLDSLPAPAESDNQ